jgi:hypothetical protein
MRPCLSLSDEKQTAERYTTHGSGETEGREALVLVARLSAGPESRLPAPFPVAILAVSTQSRLFMTDTVLPPGPKGAGKGSRIRVLLWLGGACQDGSGLRPYYGA